MAAAAARWTPSPGAGSRPPLEADPAAAALRAGVATLDPDGALVFTPPSAPAGPPPVQRAGSGPPPAEAGPPDAGAPGPTAVEAAAAPAAPPPPGTATAVAPDLDDLARRLYDRIRARLRAELRLDLERAGMLTRLGR
jgi:hypothetical protein